MGVINMMIVSPSRPTFGPIYKHLLGDHPVNATLRRGASTLVMRRSAHQVDPTHRQDADPRVLAAVIATETAK